MVIILLSLDFLIVIFRWILDSIVMWKLFSFCGRFLIGIDIFFIIGGFWELIKLSVVMRMVYINVMKYIFLLWNDLFLIVL